MTINFENSPVYINSDIRDFVIKVSDLFCLYNVDFNFKINPRMKGNYRGMCGYPDCYDIPNLRVGMTKGKVRGTTIVHELIHMMNYIHMLNINETHHFHNLHHVVREQGRRTDDEVDTYSRLVLKDLTGKYEVFL
jgi:hypothetical protein